MSLRTHPRFYDLCAAAVAGALAVTEVVRLVATRGVTAAFTLPATLITSVPFVAFLALAAVGLVLHRGNGWLFGTFGVVAAMYEGVTLLVARSAVGAVYLLGSVLLLGLLIKDLQFYREQRPRFRS